MARSHFLCILLLSAVVVCCHADSLRTPAPRAYLSRAWQYLFGAPAAAPKWPLQSEEYMLVTGGTLGDGEGLSVQGGTTTIVSKHGVFSLDGAFSSYYDKVSLKGDYVKDGQSYVFDAAAEICVPVFRGYNDMNYADLSADNYDACAEQPEAYDCFKYNKEVSFMGTSVSLTVNFIKGTSELDYMVMSITHDGQTIDMKVRVAYFSPEAPELPQEMLEAVKPCSFEKSDAGVQGPWKSTYKSNRNEEVSVQSDVIDGKRKIRYDATDQSAIFVFDKSGAFLPEESWLYTHGSSYSSCCNAYSTVVVSTFDPAFHQHDRLPFLREEEGKKEYGYDEFIKASNGPMDFSRGIARQEVYKVAVTGSIVVYDAETKNPVQLKSLCSGYELLDGTPCIENSFVATEFVREAPDASVFEVPSEWNCNPAFAETATSTGQRHRGPFGITVHA